MTLPQVQTRPSLRVPRIFRGLLLACALSTLACDADADADSDADADAWAEAFAESLATWEELRDANEGSYRYSVEEIIEEVYGEPECSLTTTFTVVEGVVTAREISGSVLEYGACPEPWMEEGDEVGQHAGPGIAEPQTLDELYSLCATEVIDSEYPFAEGDPDESEPFSVDEQGIMVRCGWSYWDSTHHQVQSSPYIVIADFEWL